MTLTHNTVSPNTVAQPRGLVIQEAWQDAGIAAPAFVGKTGVPLARAIKCLIDPLILAPRTNRDLATPLLNDDAAHKVRLLFDQARPLLESASQWFDLLRKTRRRLKITDGNVQELYFPRAYELAHQHGSPGADAEAVCQEVLTDIHHGGLAQADEVTDYLVKNQTVIAGQLQARWSREARVDVEELLAVVDAASNELAEHWDELVDADLAGELGYALRGSTEPELLASVAGPEVQLSQHTPALAPAVLEEPAEPLPLDRSVATRSRAALRRYRAVWEVIDAPELVEAEVDRAGDAWGLSMQENRAVFLLGLRLADRVHPLGTQAKTTGIVDDVQKVLDGHAYIMHLRRQLADGRAVHPLQQPVVEKLTVFWKPYLRRLWGRLHGKDVLAESSVSAQEALQVLTGVAHSVALDFRAEIRKSLEVA